MSVFGSFCLRLVDYYLDREVPSMTKYFFNIPEWPWLFGSLAGGQAVLHHFHQGDPQPDTFHSHEFDFWTFPLTTYRERVLDINTGRIGHVIVQAFRLHKRKGSILHQVEGRWYAGDHSTGVVNKYEDFWTIVVNKRKERNFDIATFEHPDDLTYAEFVAKRPRASPKPHWQNTVIYFKDGSIREVGKLFPDNKGPAVQAEHYPQGDQQ